MGLALLAALMLAGGVSAATSMRIASAKTPIVLLSQEKPEDPGESGDIDGSDPAGETPPAEASDLPEEPDQPEGVDEEGPGGVERFHEGCAFPGLMVVPDGNWTHGEYVSAWAKAGDHDALVAAAHSSCGKPMKAAEKVKKDKKDKEQLSKGKAHGKRGHGKGHKHSS